MLRHKNCITTRAITCVISLTTSVLTMRFYIDSDLWDAESGVPGHVKPGPDNNNSLPRIPADA